MAKCVITASLASYFESLFYLHRWDGSNCSTPSSCQQPNPLPTRMLLYRPNDLVTLLSVLHQVFSIIASQGYDLFVPFSWVESAVTNRKFLIYKKNKASKTFLMTFVHQHQVPLTEIVWMGFLNRVCFSLPCFSLHRWSCRMMLHPNQQKSKDWRVRPPGGATGHFYLNCHAKKTTRNVFNDPTENLMFVPVQSSSKSLIRNWWSTRSSYEKWRETTPSWRRNWSVRGVF